MKPLLCQSFEVACEHLLKSVPGDLHLGLPLGLGKPNQLANLIYDRFKKSSDRKLNIYTALSLTPPKPKSFLEKAFLDPFLDRHFGFDYPLLKYAQDQRADKLPENIHVHEFYFQAGQYSSSRSAQSSYVSLNYTHVPRALFDKGINSVIQYIAKDPSGATSKLSLSCNPDLTLDVDDLCNEVARPLFKIGVIHPDLPYLGGDALVDPEFFDVIVDVDQKWHPLFALPREPVGLTDHMIGYHASQLLVDDGTLQIGIGSLSEALVHATLLRQNDNKKYQEIAKALPRLNPLPNSVSLAPLVKGLYGTSEMLMDGFMHLRKAGVLKRLIFDNDEKKKRYLHGAFFLGSKPFYEWLRSLKGEDFDALSMTRVSKVNDLYDEHELALRRQRKNARFFNTCMQVSLLGGAAPDTLENGKVVSGIGGQYNFVAMSQELPDSHSILMLRSTRIQDGKRISNIVTGHDQLSIPRHLRDIVITEYGIACLRGAHDEEVVRQLLNITDAEFQDEMLEWAKKNLKIRADYQIPEEARRNTSENLAEWKKKFPEAFPAFPFGSDFTPEEEKIALALSSLKSAQQTKSYGKILKTLRVGFSTNSENFKAELKRLGLDQPSGMKARLYKNLVLGALASKT